MRCRRTIATAAVLILAATLAACGIPSDDQPRAIPPEAMPQSARDDATTTTTAPTTDSVQYSLYLVLSGSPNSNDTLTRVTVDGPVPANPDDVVNVVLDQLASYDPEAAGQTGLSNAVPAGTRVLSASVGADHVLDLDLSKELKEVESTGLRLAVAQIVFTVTEFGDISGVRFKIEGEPAAVPKQDGTAEKDQVVTRADYPQFNDALGTS